MRIFSDGSGLQTILNSGSSVSQSAFSSPAIIEISTSCLITLILLFGLRKIILSFRRKSSLEVDYNAFTKDLTQQRNDPEILKISPSRNAKLKFKNSDVKCRNVEVRTY